MLIAFVLFRWFLQIIGFCDALKIYIIKTIFKIQVIKKVNKELSFVKEKYAKEEKEGLIDHKANYY